MADVDERLKHLAGLYGIATEFWDWKGRYQQTSADTIVACLAALDVDITSDNWMDLAVTAVEERPWKQPLTPCTVVEQNQESYINVHVLAGNPAHVWVRLEDGATFDAQQVDNWDQDRLVDGEWIGRAAFRLPTWVAPGYHSIFLESNDQTWEASFIVTPSWLGVPQVGTGSVWGLMTQLYSVSGLTSWGVGDFSDLKDMAVWAKTQHGADYVLINPTHAAEVVPMMEPSPYLPATRKYLNPLYIRPEAIEEFGTSSEEIRNKVESLRIACREAATKTDTVDRDGVWAAKREALDLIFQGGRRTARQMDMEAFFKTEGEILRRYAVWCVLTQAYGQLWKDWPEAYQDPESREVAAFIGDHGGEVTFYMWLQWVADAQAREAQHTAKGVGMKIGIMADLAVGINKDGEETWASRDLFAKGVTVGAPPDPYNQAGQDWQQPPWRPDRLEEAAYAPVRDMMRSIMGRAGGIRVDHIIGLFRLWWVPEGLGPTQGAYMRYNHEATIGILALEAQRAGAVVVGEDLGTVEPWVREYLMRRGILGTSVLWFENGDNGLPLPPERWRELCLASVTTHDLPPTLGYLAHDHVQLRYQLGLLTESLDDEIAFDAKEQGTMLRILIERGLMAEGESDPHQILVALHRYLNQTPSKIRCVALADVVGERRTQNQPGTINEYPNWRVPLGDEFGRRLTLEDIFTMDTVAPVADIMNGKG